MSADVRIVNAILTITGTVFYVVPNSLVMTVGNGTKTQKPAIAGDSIQMVFSNNLDDAIGKFEFKLYPTVLNITNMAAIIAGENANDVIVTPAGVTTQVAYTMSNAAVTVDPPIAFSADGEISYTIEGNPITI